MSPYPPWLSPGDNAWQLVAATLVGLMSIPGIAVLYAGIVQKKWAVNTMLMAFSGFSLVLLVWVFVGFQHELRQSAETLPRIPQRVPVRVRGHHAAAVPWQRGRADQLPGLAAVRTAVVD